MTSFVFLYYDRKGQYREYKTTALTYAEAQTRYWDAQIRSGQKKMFLESFKIVNRKRVKINGSSN